LIESSSRIGFLIEHDPRQRCAFVAWQTAAHPDQVEDVLFRIML
jgi:hypothetical protein